MLVFLSMVAAGILLLTIIIVLRKLQYRDIVDSVDRTSPLPPLDGTDKQRVLSIEDVLNPAFGNSEERDPSALQSNTRDHGWLTHILAMTEDPSIPEKDWQSRARHYLSVGDHPRALMSCARAFPQMGAFRQACVVIRGRIRELRKADSTWEPELEMLYRIATCADLLHSKWAGQSGLSTTQLRHIDILQCQNFPLEYERQGYRKLGLLGSTDWKLLEELWGEPFEHHHAREIHGDVLIAMLDSHKSG